MSENENNGLLAVKRYNIKCPNCKFEGLSDDKRSRQGVIAGSTGVLAIFIIIALIVRIFFVENMVDYVMPLFFFYIPFFACVLGVSISICNKLSGCQKCGFKNIVSEEIITQ